MKKQRILISVIFLSLFSFCSVTSSYGWWYKTGPNPQIKDLERRIKIYEELLTIVEHQKANVSQQMQSLGDRKKVIIRTIAVKENEMEDMNHKVVGIQEASRSVSDVQMAQMQKREKEYSAQIEALGKELIEEKQKLKETEAILSNKAHQLDALNAKYSSLKKKPQQYEEELALVQRHTQALYQSNEELRGELAEKEDLIKNFESEKEALANKPTEYEEKLLMAEWEQKDLKAAYEILEGLLQEKESALGELNEKIAKQKYEIKDQKFALDRKHEELESVTEDLSFYKKQSDKIDFLLEQKNADIHLLRQQLLSLKKELIAKQNVIIKKNKDLSFLQEQLSVSEARVQEVLHRHDMFISSLKEDMKGMRNK